ncbi:RCC1 and BTB domain-containing protein 1-like [Cloeon dipterum]|uniref:RCC1 and BTB domain-containing protein 1-like n=1 Tax=Cloeon dipterum TaxID=197152 RepID=UPI00322007AD
MRQHLLEAIRKKKAPHKVGSLRGVAISKIVSSSNKILALSYDGDVHFWQRTDSDQPGSSFENGNLIFATISTAIGRVKDIAAVYHDDVQNFAAITETDDVYIWQQCNGETLSSPTLTSFSTLDQVFAQQARTFRPLKSEEEKVIPGKIIAKSSLNECAQQFMDDTETSDFAFVVEGKKIHVHKLILMMRCAVFKTMFQGDWKESNTSEQTVEGHSYVAFYAFMKYFYTDEIDLPPDSALELLALAHFYHLPALQEKCGKFIKRGVTVENAAAIFEKAIQYEAKELEEYVFKFCVDHMTGVISSDGFKTLKPDTLSELLRRAAQHGAFKN